METFPYRVRTGCHNRESIYKRSDGSWVGSMNFNEAEGRHLAMAGSHDKGEE